MRIQVFDRSHPSMPRGEAIGQIYVTGDFQFEHLAWALAADDEEYPPYHYIEQKEWTSSWGAFSEGADIIIDVMNNPYISHLVTYLAGAGAMATARLMDRIRSSPLSEERATHHAKLWIAQSTETDVAHLTVVAAGTHSRGARWVDLQTDTMRWRVGVALTTRGAVSVAVESWELRNPDVA